MPTVPVVQDANDALNASWCGRGLHVMPILHQPEIQMHVNVIPSCPHMGDASPVFPRLQKYPQDFMADARPATQTTNQMLRVLGTYQEDYLTASRLGLFIPPGVPKGWHPDVKTAN
jgi:hypothetical protein